MNLEFVVARLIHIVFGVFWVGAAVFLVFVVGHRTGHEKWKYSPVRFPVKPWSGVHGGIVETLENLSYRSGTPSSTP